MSGEGRLIDDPKHGETLVVTLYVRRRDLERESGLEGVIAFASRDITRRALSWKTRWRKPVDS